MRLVLLAAALAAAVICVSCTNVLAAIVEKDVNEYKAAQSQTPPIVDSFILTNATSVTNPATNVTTPTVYTSDVQYTISATQPGAGATSITHWMVTESQTAPLASDPAWSEMAPAVNGAYTASSSYALSAIGNYTLYAWLKNDRDLVSASATAASASVAYCDFGAPVVVCGLNKTLNDSPTDNPKFYFTYDSKNSSPGEGATSITGWLVNESTKAPAAGDIPTVTDPPAYTVTLVAGAHTIYVWAKNDQNKVGWTTIPVFINHHTATLPTCALIAGHESVAVTFDDVDTNSIRVTGGGTPPMNPQEIPDPADWNGSTLTVHSQSLWPLTGGSITITGTTSHHVQLDQATRSYSVFYGACVSSVGNSPNPGSSEGTGGTQHPLDTIQAAITIAKSKYIDVGSGPAEIRVASCSLANAYSASCSLSPDAYVANMVEGVSLYGRYSTYFESRTSYQSYVVDNDTQGNNSSETAPIRAIYCDSTITTNTTIDGFTVIIGTNAGSHSGIYCYYGSPTIQNNTIQGSYTSPSANAEGIYLYYSGARILYNTIDPGYSTTGLSCAIYGTYAGSSSALIDHNTLSGGKSDNNTFGIRAIYLTASITNNTINGGNWTNLGNCIRVSNCSPAITDNHFQIYSSVKFATYAIYELNGSANPSSVRRNDFDYLGNWYYDYGNSTPTITNDNWSTVMASTGEGSAYLCLDSPGWDNYSTYFGINLP